MAWMPVDQFLTGHRKTLDLAKRQGWSPRYTAGVLLDVWGWAIDHCPHGYVDGAGPVSPGTSLGTGPKPEEASEGAATTPQDHRASLAKALRMRRDEVATLLRHMSVVGWLDREGPTKGRLHEWDEWGGKIVAKREYEKEKKRRIRANKGTSDRVSPGTEEPRPEGQQLTIGAATRPGCPSGQAPASTDLSRGTSRGKTRRDERREDENPPPPGASSAARGTTGGAGGGRLRTAEELREENEAKALEIVTGASGLWQTALENIRSTLPMHVFVTWFAGTRWEQHGEVHYVVAPNSYARDWIVDRYAHIVRASIGVLVGEIGVDVRIVLEDELPKPSTTQGAA